MKVIMDADCHIKLTKSKLKEFVCNNFSVVMPKLVEKEGKIEEATAMRKLIRIGFETYIGHLYEQGKITLREAGRLLNMNQIETINLFLDAGIKGNLEVSDVLFSLERFALK